MNNLRPTKLSEIIGQNDIKEILKISINSAKERHDTFPNCLLFGSAGLGKTTFAQCIANEMGVKYYEANGGSLRTIKNVIPYILKIERGDILFIDEAQSLSKVTEEFLYSIIEDYFFILGSDEDTIKMTVPRFSLILATTESGSISKPLKDRIKLPLFFSCYTESDLARLALSNATKLNIHLDPDAALDIANRSRGTPRILNKYLEWCRDYSLSKSDKKITLQNAQEAMKVLKISPEGFTLLDRRAIILLKGANTPLSIETICSILKVDKMTYINEVESFLVSKGLIGKCTKGRYYCGKD